MTFSILKDLKVVFKITWDVKYKQIQIAYDFLIFWK